MTSEHQQKTQKSNGRDPDLIVYTVQSRGDDKSSIWTRLGAGWKHKDGKGYDLQCQAYPVDGRLTVRFSIKPELLRTKRQKLRRQITSLHKKI